MADPTKGNILRPSATLTRPADTTQYAIGDALLQSTTAGSCTPLEWTVAIEEGTSIMIRRLKASKTSTILTSALVRMHFFTSLPTISTGDNAARGNTESGWIGSIDVTFDTAFSDAANGIGIPNQGSEISAILGVGIVKLYGIPELRGTYTPTSAEVFTFTPDIIQIR